MSQLIPSLKDLKIETIEVDSPDLGKFMIHIADQAADCKWYGPYQTGKLAIYTACIHPMDDNPSEFKCLIFVYVDDHSPDEHSLGYDTFPLDMNNKDCVAQLLDYVDTCYIAKTMQEKSKANVSHLH